MLECVMHILVYISKEDKVVKNNKYEIDMCNGTLMDKLISFAIPLMLSGMLQLMFNAVDIIVVGRFTGSTALAAVGSTTALISTFTNLFIGVSLGANVLAARFYATGKAKEMSETVAYSHSTCGNKRCCYVYYWHCCRKRGALSLLTHQMM